MPGPVSIVVDREICWITINNPPVNALSKDVRERLMECLKEVKARHDCRCVILTGEGRTLSAGADIAEFDTVAHSPVNLKSDKTVQQDTAPSLNQVFTAIEELPVPSIAAIHGATLGGGLELALACHYRVAADTAKVGFPELSLGIIPGAGGTQRAPRLMGIERALDLILSSRPITADSALAQGLVDDVVPEREFRTRVEAFARRVMAQKPISRVRDRIEHIAGWDHRQEWFAQARAKSKTDEDKAAIDALEAAATLPFDQGLRREREIVLKLIASPAAVARRHAFFAERKTTKIPGLNPNIPPAELSHVAIIGGGQMGSGIATALLEHGCKVTIVEQSQDAFDVALSRIRENWSSRLRRGALTDTEVSQRLARLHGSTELEAVKPVELIIEAVWENMALKQAIFKRLSDVANPSAVLATNTSGLDVNEIAAVTARPSEVVGLHFFSPAHVMRLLEVVRARQTSDRCLATALALARLLKKVPVVVGVCAGFVGNRLFAARDQQATPMLLEGASPTDIDAALEAFGFPMGVFKLYDMAGAIELGWRQRQDRIGPEDEIGDALYHAGRLGQRAGKGYYRYEKGSRTPHPDPEVESIIESARSRRGIIRRQIPQDEIIERMILPMVNECAKILDEGIAIRASDIDVVWNTGYGWPLSKGGPAYYGDALGLPHVLERLRKLQARHGSHFAPSPPLEKLVTEGHTLASLSRA